MVKNKHSLQQNWVKMRVKQLSGSKVTEGGTWPQGKVVRGWDSHPVGCECSPILGCYPQEPVKLPTAWQDGEAGRTWAGRLGDYVRAVAVSRGAKGTNTWDFRV